jgi:hypothetical protein
MRNFRSMRDIHLSYAFLEQIDSIRELLNALLGLDIASARFRASIAGHEIRLSQILLTSLARLAIDGKLVIEPVEPERLGMVRDALMTTEHPARVSDQFHKMIEDVLDRRLDEKLRGRASGYVNSCVNMLEEEFAELPRNRPIDPRFVRSLLIRRS